MKHSIKICYAATILCLTGLIQQGCDKVDQYYHDVTNRPQVNTREEVDLAIKGKYARAGYKSVYAVGDTATWTGMFFLDAELPVIRIGQAEAEIVHQEKFTPAATTASELNELVRFVISDEMGIGTNRPVSIAANGITVGAPDITINGFVGLDGRTDTTLFVDKLVTWQPDKPEDYYIPGAERPNFSDGKLPWIHSASATIGNIIYFSNSLGVFRVNSNGNVEEWLHADEELMDEAGQTFSLRYIINAVVDHTHTSVYVSAQVNESGPDADKNYIFRLLKIDTQDKSVVTLNRTLLTRNPSDPGITANPVDGPVKDMRLIATQMTWTTSGLYLSNAVLSKPFKLAPDNAYKNYLYDIIRHRKTGSFLTYAVNTLCRLDPVNNTVRVLMHSRKNTSAGLEIADVYQYRTTPDGSRLYVIPLNVKLGGFGIMYYDIALGQPIFTKIADQSETPLQFISFDTIPQTGYVTNSSYRLDLKLTDVTYPLRWTVSPRGEIITDYNTITGNLSPSLVAANIDANKFYCYAGTERGIFTVRDEESCIAAPGQNQETGRAKWVEFGEQDCSLSTNNTITPSFIGFDPRGSILYFYKFSTVGTQQPYSPIRFYRLYPKEN